MPYELDRVRDQFPALAIADDGVPRIYFDNPAGTQVPVQVIEAMRSCLVESNANVHGYFQTSRNADAVIAYARDAMADLLNAPSSDDIVFGQNMTTITLHLSRSIGRLFEPGDEIVLSRMDHDANVAPWLLMARDHDLVVKWLPFSSTSFEFDLADLQPLLSDRTRLVCVGAASNLIGTINDVTAICKAARDIGALTYIDAVQAVPHIPIDVQAIGCDFLVCSAYKFFGPHQGILWGRRELMQRLDAFKVRPAADDLPDRFETGTQSHEGMAGTAAAVDYLAWVGKGMAQDYLARHAHFEGRRQLVHAALDCLFDYESSLSARLIDGLQAIPDVTVQGITDASRFDRRVPTVSFTCKSRSPDDIARQLAQQNIFVWSGDVYAVEAARALDILDSGGAVRVGPVHYNTIDEVDRTLNVLSDALSRPNAA